MKTGDWLAGNSEEYFNAGPYKTREIAIQDAIGDLGLDVGDNYYTGQVTMYIPEIDADRLLDDQEELAGDNCSGCEGWDIDRKNIKRLETELNEVFISWLLRNKQMPRFGEVNDVEHHEVKP